MKNQPREVILFFGLACRSLINIKGIRWFGKVELGNNDDVSTRFTQSECEVCHFGLNLMLTIEEKKMGGFMSIARR
jgi:hypothetical protein